MHKDTVTDFLVLLPGLDGTGLLFEPLLAALPNNIQTNVVSYPSHTHLTLAEQITHIKTHLPNHPYFLLAESYSGNAAIRLAAEHSPNLQGLILSTTFASNPRPALSFTEPLVAWLPLKIVPSAWLGKLLFYRSSHQLTDLLTQAFANVPTHTLRKRLQSVIHNDSTCFLPRITVPTLILQARYDYLVPKISGKILTQKIPHNTYQILDGGHGLLQDNPKATAKIIIKFIQNHHRQR